MRRVAKWPVETQDPSALTLAQLCWLYLSAALDAVASLAAAGEPVQGVQPVQREEAVLVGEQRDWALRHIGACVHSLVLACAVRVLSDTCAWRAVCYLTCCGVCHTAHPVWLAQGTGCVFAKATAAAQQSTHVLMDAGLPLSCSALPVFAVVVQHRWQASRLGQEAHQHLESSRAGHNTGHTAYGAQRASPEGGLPRSRQRRLQPRLSAACPVLLQRGWR
jgi:hypothetical protein